MPRVHNRLKSSSLLLFSDVGGWSGSKGKLSKEASVAHRINQFIKDKKSEEAAKLNALMAEKNKAKAEKEEAKREAQKAQAAEEMRKINEMSEM